MIYQSIVVWISAAKTKQWSNSLPPDVSDMWILWKFHQNWLVSMVAMYRMGLIFSYFTGIIIIKLTIASKKASNFDPSTATTIGFGSRTSLSISTADSSDLPLGFTGMASKCCNSWYSEPVSIIYLIKHRMMNRALNVCQTWSELQWQNCERMSLGEILLHRLKPIQPWFVQYFTGTSPHTGEKCAKAAQHTGDVPSYIDKSWRSPNHWRWLQSILHLCLYEVVTCHNFG